MFKSVLLLVSFVSSIAFAGLAEDFQTLKTVPRNYTDSGSICEEVARLRLAEVYQAPQYTVETGIAYGNAERTIGELDVIVFDNNTQKAIRLAEVKCWKDASAGLSKARNQRERFLKNVRSNQPLRFTSTSTARAYSADQFRYVTEFISIAQKGTTQVGYDMELEYSLKELHDLRQQLLNCQSRGECASAN